MAETNRIVTELVVDARPAEQGTASYIAAMRKAEQVRLREIETNEKLARASGSLTPIMTRNTDSVMKMAAQIARLQAAADPAMAAQRKLEDAALKLDAAMRRGIISQEEAASTLAGYRTRVLGADAANDNLREGVQQADRAFDRFRQSIGLTEDRLQKMQTRAAGAMAALSEARMLAAGAAGAAGLGGAFAFSGVVETATEFQKLGASLKTVTGSGEAAERAFAFIRQFAAETPYTLQEVTEAFIKLQSLGLDPSRASLEAYGNTASAMGKPIMQFIEAVADAVTGENERLKEFGIRASKDGEKVSYTFQGVTTTIGSSAKEIETYLRRIGQVQFGGAMAEQMKILPGAFGNAQDAIANFQNAIGEGGLSAVVQDATTDFTNFLNSNEDLARSIGSVVGAELGQFRTDVKDVVEDLTSAWRWTKATIEVIGGLVSGFGTGGAEVAKVSQGMVGGAEAFGTAWTATGRLIYDVLNGIIGAGVGSYRTIVATWDSLPAAFGALAKSAGNALVSGIEAAVNGSIAGVNSLIASINSVAPEFAQIGEFKPVDLKDFKASLSEAETAAKDTVGSIMSDAMATDYLGAGARAIAEPIQKAASEIAAVKGRLDDAANATGAVGEQIKLTGEGFQIAAGQSADAIDGGITKPTKEATKALREAEAARKHLFSEADAAVEEYFPFETAMAEAKRLQSVIDDTTNGLSDLQRQALGMKINQNFVDARDSVDGMGRRVRGLRGDMEDMGRAGVDALEGVVDALMQGGNAAEGLISTFASCFGSIATMDSIFEEGEGE